MRGLHGTRPRTEDDSCALRLEPTPNGKFEAREREDRTCGGKLWAAGRFEFRRTKERGRGSRCAAYPRNATRSHATIEETPRRVEVRLSNYDETLVAVIERGNDEPLLGGKRTGNVLGSIALALALPFPKELPRLQRPGRRYHKEPRCAPSERPSPKP